MKELNYDDVNYILRKLSEVNETGDCTIMTKYLKKFKTLLIELNFEIVFEQQDNNFYGNDESTIVIVKHEE